MAENSEGIVTADSSADDERVILECAFGHIEAGNNHEGEQDYWSAANEFQTAWQTLETLVKARLVNNANTAGKEQAYPDGDGEYEKIQKLYREQANEYFHRAREALIKAMALENEKDKQSRPTEVDHEARQRPMYHFDSLMNRDLENRLRLFQRLFAKDVEVQLEGNETGDVEQSSSTAEKQQLSLEERLAQLDDSLPKGFQTSEKRLQEINRGLNRLGLSLYSAADEAKKNAWRSEVPKSETDQVNEIIAQAADEVALLGVPNETANAGGGSGVVTDTADAFDDQILAMMDESDLESNDDNDASQSTPDEDLKPEQITQIRENLIDAQAELAQLIALMEFDDGGDAEIEFEADFGKRALMKARKLLQQATKTWVSPSGGG